MNEEVVIEYLGNMAEYRHFPKDYFDMPLGYGCSIFSVASKTPGTARLFACKAYYNTILDLVAKIKLSYFTACHNGLVISDVQYNPFDAPTENETLGGYFAENAAFRISILWDILAQLYNIKFNCNLPENKINYQRLFHNKAQTGEPFAKKIYTYISEVDTDDPLNDTKYWPGNHQYVVNFRNSLAHRNSPNVTTITATTHALRPPVIYVFKRVIEDFSIVCEFLWEALESIHNEYASFFAGLENASQN